MLRISPLLIVFVFALNLIDSQTTHAPRKLFITVYYESLCPDSRLFITKHLEPTFYLLHKYLKLSFVPFGKATSINNGRNGFQCQHGPSECAGNLVQSCALDLMQGRNDMEKISYVSCEMRTAAGTTGDMKCVRKAGLPVDAVEQCAHSDKGIQLQLKQELLTKSVRPKFIPTITIDGVFDQHVQNAAIEDFRGTLCFKLKNVPECTNYYNPMAWRQQL